MSEELSTQFQREGQTAFSSENKEGSSSASSTENANAGQTGSPAQDKPQVQNQDGGEYDWSKFPPINEHPRWKERDNDWNKRYNEQEERHVNELADIRKEFDGKLTARPTSEDVPDWFGGDKAAYDLYETEMSKRFQAVEERAFKRFSDTRTAEQKKIDDATAYFDGQVTEIETNKALNPQGLKIDRNKLLKTALDNEIVDTQGRWNYKAAFKMMKPDEVFAAKAALNDRKQLANATVEGSQGGSAQPAIPTSQTFANPANRPW